jgi:hypothetical protein
MSSLKLDNIQVGRDSDPTKNFHFRTVAANDFRLSSGNIGSPVNDLMKLTNTDVTLLNPKAIATPPQFDNSKLLATTDWVQGNGAMYSNNGGIGLSSNLTINPTHFGKWLDIQANNIVINLPVPTNDYLGKVFTIRANLACTLVASAGLSIASGLGVQNNSLVIQAGQIVTVICNGFGGHWYLVSAGFAQECYSKSLSSNGYQRLPSGLILQWGNVSIPGNSVITVTFPIAFPTAALLAQAQKYDAAANGTQYRWDCSAPWLTGVNICNNWSDWISGCYIAIGY